MTTSNTPQKLEKERAIENRERLFQHESTQSIYPIYIGGPSELMFDFAQQVARSINQRAFDENHFHMATHVNTIPKLTHFYDLENVSLLKQLHPSIGLSTYQMMYRETYVAINPIHPRIKNVYLPRYSIISNPHELTFEKWITEAFYTDLLEKYRKLRKRSLVPKGWYNLLTQIQTQREWTDAILNAYLSTPIVATAVQKATQPNQIIVFAHRPKLDVPTIRRRIKALINLKTESIKSIRSTKDMLFVANCIFDMVYVPVTQHETTVEQLIDTIYDRIPKP